MRAKFVAAIAILALAAGAASAHPHVWVEGTATLNFDAERRVGSVTVRYALDEMTTAVLVEGLDADENGLFDREELKALAAENAVSLGEFDYFLEVSTASGRVAVTEATGYDYAYIDGQMVLMLELALERAVNPVEERMAIRLYDPSFYVLVELAADAPLLIRGAEAEFCRVTIKGPAEASEGVTLSDDQLAVFDTSSIGRDYADEISLACGGEG